MGLKMGVLSGAEIFGHKSTQIERDKAIAQLNHGELDGLIMTDRVGACGHNLTGANVMIFLGSLYSQPYEDQAVGNIS
jgi:superfamily II DNA or RNA helicase